MAQDERVGSEADRLRIEGKVDGNGPVQLLSIRVVIAQTFYSTRC